MEDKPKTVSISLHPGQLQRLMDLVKTRIARQEFTSRSALVRQALNLGLTVLAKREMTAEHDAQDMS